MAMILGGGKLPIAQLATHTTGWSRTLLVVEAVGCQTLSRPGRASSACKLVLHALRFTSALPGQLSKLFTETLEVDAVR